jgi:nucleoside-diphosphate-sugar epimerase
MVMKVFITGANGKLARELVPVLGKRNKLILSSRNAVETRKIYGSKFGIDEVDLERISVEGLKKLVKSVDVIVHTAALVDFKASRESLMKANAEITRKLSETGKPIIYISSVSVYGAQGFYGESKKEGEKWVRKNKAHVILRFGMIYGGGFTKGFKEVIDLIRKGFVFTLGSGDNRIPLVYYKDAVKSVDFALKNFKKLKNKSFDVVFQPEPTQKECVKEVARQVGVKKKPLKISLSFARLLSRFLGKQDYVRMLSEDRVCSNTIKNFKFDYSLGRGVKELLKGLFKASR